MSPSVSALKPQDRYVIGILGPVSFGDYLEEIVTGKTVIVGKSRAAVPIRVVRFNSFAEIGNCHMLYISPETSESLDLILRNLAGKSVISLGKGEDFARRGGIIGFMLKNNKVGYAINQGAAKQSQVVIHSYIKKNAVHRY